MRRFVVTAILSWLLLCPVAFAEVVQSSDSDTIDTLRLRITELEEKVTALEAENARLRSEIEHYQFLREETERYRQFIEREQSAFKDFLEKLLGNSAKIVTLTLTVVGGVLGFFGVRTFKDIKLEMERQVQRKVQEKIAGTEAHVNALDDLVRRELLRRNARVTVAATTDDLEALRPIVIKHLRRQGIQLKVAQLPDMMSALLTDLRNREIDILVYRYRPQRGNHDPVLDELVHTVLEHGLEIPILIYVPGGLQVGVEYVSQYGYITYANTPMTVVTNLNALVPTFGRRLSHDASSVS